MDPTERDASDLVELVWNPSASKRKLFNGDPIRDLSHEAYFEYYTNQCHLIAGHGGGNYVALHTAQEMNGLVNRLRSDDSREDILAGLKAQFASRQLPADDAFENTINLAARLLLMLKFGIVKGQAIPRRYLRWSTASLGAFVKSYFDEAAPRLNCDHVRLPKAFDAWSISTIGGIAIDFTDNLADHLLLVEDDSKVLIFHHASFLELQHE